MNKIKWQLLTWLHRILSDNKDNFYIYLTSKEDVKSFRITLDALIQMAEDDERQYGCDPLENKNIVAGKQTLARIDRMIERD